MTHPSSPSPPPGPGRAVEVFQFPATGASVRTVVRDGEPWFVVADVCAVLGIANVGNALARLDDDEKDSIRLADGTSGNPNRAVVSEAGLYDLIIRSDKPDAKRFRRWITHEVLPAIRRTGTYTAPAAAEMDELEVARRYVLALEAKKELEATVADQRAQLAIAAPKAEYVDGFVNPTEDASTVRVFAGQLGVGEKVLRDWMVARHLIYRRTVDQRWSRSKQRLEPVYEWLARSPHATWFTPVDQPQAPRLHNGQMATTLYVTPVGKVQIRRLLMKHPIDAAEPRSA